MTDGKPRRAPMLDGRLSAAMALAKGAEVFADIGADHGKLSAAMLLSGGARHGLVADVSAAALEKARRRLAGLGLNGRVTYAVADGLEALGELGGHIADTAFLLGMGGETLSGILRRGYDRLHGATLVLGAQNGLPLVRQTLCDISYRVRHELVAAAGGRDYVLMRCTPAMPGEPLYTERECLLGPVFLRERPPEWLRVLNRRKRLLEQSVAAMRGAGLDKDAKRLAQFERELCYVNDQVCRMDAAL